MEENSTPDGPSQPIHVELIYAPDLERNRTTQALTAPSAAPATQ